MASRRLLTVELIDGLFLGNLRTTESENVGFNQRTEFTTHSKLDQREFGGVQLVANQGSG
jgi:hypothetical protein